jgi:hypothetical protein
MDKHIKEVGVIMEENSRRSFFKKAAAAVGVVAAAGYTTTLISRSSATNSNAGEKYAADLALQEKVMTGNPLILMTEDEKKQRIDVLLDCYYQAIA